MAGTQAVPVEVHLDREATANEVAAVKAAFNRAGLDSVVKADLERKGIGDYPWVIYISVPAGIFLRAFLEAAGKDAYAQLKQLVLSANEARRDSKSPPGSIVLMDKESHEWVMLERNLPDIAWQRLFETEVGQTESGQLRWDPKTESWRDTWDI